ncbi:MAG: MlaD family protein [Bacteroidales bacterium]|jgi:phospholipid/cholesterol/gamma-HCH transport system substrate-binding protein|nr:MlaD family protein [Bacteroidales bacterium]
MKISNEVKIGAVALVTILVFIWLFNFLKGKDYFKRTVNYYAVYDNIGGLAESSPVEINGFKVGIVQSIRLLDPTSGKLLVVFSVGKDFRLPVNTVAEILPTSLIAGMKAQFVYGDGPGYYSFGDTIPGRLSESLLTTLDDVLEPIKQKVLSMVTVLDSVITSINDVIDPEFKKNLQGTMTHLDNTTGSLDRILGSKETELKKTLDNITKFSDMLSANTQKMNSTFSNLESITDTLAAADLYNSISNLKASLEKASTLIENLNDGKGSAGQILTNDSLYTNLNNSLASLNLLLEDVKSNPKRYVHFSLFGKKNIPSE